MNSAGPHQSFGATWFVGACFGHTDDQTARFLEEGIWEISSSSQEEQALVRSMRPVERIAIKAAMSFSPSTRGKPTWPALSKLRFICRPYWESQSSSASIASTSTTTRRHCGLACGSEPDEQKADDAG